MSTATPGLAAPPVVRRESLRVVLFGMPGAGKSSLLGALVQAADTQTDRLQWRLPAVPEGLAELRSRLYEDRLRPTSQVVVPHPVVFEPAGGRGRHLPAVFMDCDGGVALRLLGRESLDGDHAEGQLAREILQADALLLVVPAADPPPADEDFAQFERFLKLLEQRRGRQIAVAGLPVFLVLTKCDRLVAPDESIGFADWVDRIEGRKRELYRRFAAFRDRQPSGSPSPFGRVELHLGATAVRRPALGPTPAEPTQPFGVAELFRQALDRAGDFRRRSRRSNRLLTGTLLAAVGLLVLMIGLAVFFTLLQRQRLREADQRAVAETAAAEAERYEELARRGQALASFQALPRDPDEPVPWREWLNRVQNLLAEAAPRAPDEPVPGGTSATYEAVYNRAAVRQARDRWQEVRERLEDLRNLAAALGVVEAAGRPPLLDVPPPPEFTAREAGPLLERLHTQYPDYRGWELRGLPQDVTRDLRSAAEVSYQNVLEAGREEILDQLQRLSPANRESAGLWEKLREWLIDSGELRAWKDLAGSLRELADPKAEDPLQALRAFLAESRFPIELQRLVLRVPDDRDLRPAGKLTIYHGTGEDVQTVLTFKQQGVRPAPDSQARLYTFVPEGGESLAYRLIYQPGDTLWADLPVKGPTGDNLLLTWSVSRSMVYQFDRLRKPPRLHRADEVSTAGELLERVELRVAEGQLPQLPELMPVVILKPPEPGKP